MSACACVATFDAELKGHNGRIESALIFSEDMTKLKSRVVVATVKIDKAKRKPVPKVLARYCPFCGVKAEDA